MSKAQLVVTLRVWIWHSQKTL